MSDLRQTDATASSHGQYVAGRSSGATGLVASTNKPIGVVAPQKRVTVPSNTATSPSCGRTSRYISMPAAVARGQVNDVAAQPPNPLQSQEAGPSGAQGNRTASADPEKLELMQQQFMLSLHVYNCRRRDSHANGERWQPCTLPHCRTMKNLLNHVSTCNAGKECTVPHCSSSRQIIGHWKHFFRNDGLVSLPLTQADDNWRMKIKQNENAGSAANDGSVKNIIRLPDSQPTARTQLVLPNTAAPVQRHKAWHASFTRESRDSIVLEMAESIFSYSQLMFGRRIIYYSTFCHKVENNAYEEANSRAEYYHLIVQKILKYQKEREEKRQQLRQRHQMQDQQQIRAAPARVNPLASLHLKRSKPLLKSARAMPKPIGTVRPTLRMFIRVHSNGMRVLQNRTHSNGQTTSNLARPPAQLQANPTAARAPAITGPASNSTAAPVAAPPVSAQPRPNTSGNEPIAGTSASNSPPVQIVAPAPQVGRQEARKFSIQRYMQGLVHACQCKYANCRLPSCQRMKRVLQHIKTCKRRTSGGCPICKQLVALCCHHARPCQEAKCPVPFCFNVKQKLKQRQHHQRLQQARVISNLTNFRYQPNAVMQQNTGLRQQTPQLLQQQQQQQQQQQVEQQQQPQQGQQSVMGGMAAQIPRQAGAMGPAGGQVQNAAGKQALQQLMQTLRNPNTREQQNQILHILKSNPPLMAAFIKQRQINPIVFSKTNFRGWISSA